MTLTLPDDPVLLDLGADVLRLDLGCALYAAGRVSRSVACRIADVEREIFDRELLQSRVPSYSDEMFDADLETLERIR